MLGGMLGLQPSRGREKIIPSDILRHHATPLEVEHQG